jgi:hypothetical protein
MDPPVAPAARQTHGRADKLWLAATVSSAVPAIFGGAHGVASDTSEAGLVGCGDRGAIAALNAINAEPPTPRDADGEYPVAVRNATQFVA